MENLTLKQKGQVIDITWKCACARFSFNTHIDSTIKRKKFSYATIMTLIDKMTNFKNDIINYVNSLPYEVVEIDLFQLSPILYQDFRDFRRFVDDDENYNYFTELCTYVGKVLEIRNLIVKSGCDENTSKQVIGKCVSMLKISDLQNFTNIST